MDRPIWQTLRELVDPTYVPQAEAVPWKQAVEVLTGLAKRQNLKPFRVSAQEAKILRGLHELPPAAETGIFPRFAILDPAWKYVYPESVRPGLTAEKWLGPMTSRERGSIRWPMTDIQQYTDLRLPYYHEFPHSLTGPLSFFNLNRYVYPQKMKNKAFLPSVEKAIALSEGFADAFAMEMAQPTIYPGRYLNVARKRGWQTAPDIEMGEEIGREFTRNIQLGRNPRQTLIDSINNLLEMIKPKK